MIERIQSFRKPKKKTTRTHAFSIFGRVWRDVLKKVKSVLSRATNNILSRRETSTSSVRLSIKEQTFFAKRLSFLIQATIPMLDSLNMIREQTVSRRYARVLDSVIQDIAQGQNLSTSLKKFPRTFGEFAINIIGVGEATGILSGNLVYLADEMNKKHVLRRKIIGAFIYPIVVSIATVVITVFLMVYLFPKILPLFASLDMELPLPTRMVMAISNFLIHYGVYAFLAIVAVIIIFPMLVHRSAWLRYKVHRTLLRLPIFGNVVRSYNLANMSRTMGLLLKSGITLTESLHITARTMSNVVYKQELDSLHSTVSRGERISTHLKRSKALFGDVLPQLVAVGERTGNLPDSLIYVSQLHEGEVDDFAKNVSSLIEPVLMVMMGLVVGLIAISIIQPIYGITQHLQPTN